MQDGTSRSNIAVVVTVAIMSIAFSLFLIPTSAFASSITPIKDPEYLALKSAYFEACEQASNFKAAQDQYDAALAQYNADPSEENFEWLMYAEMEFEEAKNALNASDYTELVENENSAKEALYSYIYGFTASGTWGTCDWEIADGILTIHEGTGVPATKAQNGVTRSPWIEYAPCILKIKTDGTVILPQNSNYLFSQSADDGNRFATVEADLSGFDTSSVTDMHGMFYGSCDSLENLNLTGWDTSKVTDMSFMFDKCSSLASLNLSSFDTSNVTNMSRMFGYCSKLKTIYVSALWNTDNVVSSSDMFNRCTSIFDSNRTVISPLKTDKTYAYASTPETPGYLTFKAAQNNPFEKTGDGSTITIETEASTINVTVPTNAAFIFKSDGTNVYPTNYEITNNNGLTAITLDAIDFQGVNGWTFASENETFQADVKKFALWMSERGKTLVAAQFAGNEGGIEFSWGDSEPIRIAPNGSKILDFQAKRGVFTEAVTTENAMQMTMHSDWEHAA